MKKILHWLRNNWFLFLVFLLVIMLGLGLIFRKIANERRLPPPTMSGGFTNEQTKFDRFSFVGDPIDAPQELAVITAAVTFLPLQEIADSLIEKYQLEPTAYDVNTFTGDAGILFVDEPTRSVRLNFYTDEPVDQNLPDYIFTPINPNETQAVADQLIATLPTSETLRLNPELTRYSDEHEPLVAVAPADATLVSYTYEQHLRNLPVVVKNSQLQAAQVNVLSTNELKSIQYVPIEIKELVATNYPSISIADAINNINKDNASLVYAGNELAEPIEVKRLSEGKLTDVSIEYRSPNESQGEQQLMPYYKFTGTAVDAAANPVKVIVLTPAIQTKK